MTQSAYAQAGVDIDAGQKATSLMKQAVQATYGAEVLTGIGAFGGLFDVSALKEMEHPVLVASTDGVGTKTKVAAKLNKWDTIGHDIVNHCINDILVQGAKPLFFLDYVASSRLEPLQIATIVRGAAAACVDNGCALLGGETAEMPGVYQDGEVDLVGTIVGVVDRPKIIDGSRIQPDDLILALPANSPHTNGYTLLRSVLAHFDWNEHSERLGMSIGAAALAPHRSYLNEVHALIDAGIDIRGLAHITGGGVVDNLPRILPEGTGALIERGTWDVLPIFELIQEVGGIDSAEMFRVFNMGLGMLVILPPDQLDRAQAVLPELDHVGSIHTTSGVIIA